MARPRKRRAFGSLMVVRRGEHKYLQAGYEPPMWAFSKWKGLHIPKRITKSFALNERMKAEAWLYKMQRSIEKDTWEPPQIAKKHEEASSVTFGDYATRWLAHRKKSNGDPISEGTRGKYAEYLRNHLKKFIPMRLSDISVEDVNQWWESFPIGVHGEGETARAHSYVMLKAVLAEAAKPSDGSTPLIKSNPCTISTRQHREKHEQVIATREELEHVWEAMPPRYALSIYLAGVMGLRRGEVLGLERRDVDFERMRLNIRRSAKWHKEGKTLKMVTGSTKTANAVRSIPIPTALKPIIERHLNDYVGKSDSAFLFTGRDGKSLLGLSAFETIWRKARNKVPRLKGMHFHDLRHTALTRLAQHGATVAELEQVAGHADARTAMHYQHAVDEHERQVINDAADKPQEQKQSEEVMKTASAPKPTDAQQQETDPKKLADLLSSWDLLSRTKFLTTLSPELRNQVVAALAASK